MVITYHIYAYHIYLNKYFITSNAVSDSLYHTDLHCISHTTVKGVKEGRQSVGMWLFLQECTRQ